MVDKVFIEGLTLDCVIGVYAHEKTFRQRLFLDLEMAFDLSRAGASDDLRLTLDYHAISQRLIAYASAHQVALLETLAERMAEILLSEFRVPWLRLKIRKPGAVAEAVTVGIEIERGSLPRD
ncbi:MAG: dihydroneopterin aldolase [Hahellaceae bacterium]|jgi:dihydroneopterin aldolase|nr:dihydroneopterin aldolase [Hahellaceae bacterium]